MVVAVALVAALADVAVTVVVVEASPEVASVVAVAATEADAVASVDVAADVVSPQEAAADSETEHNPNVEARLTDRTLDVCQLELTQSSLVKEIDLNHIIPFL